MVTVDGVEFTVVGGPLPVPCDPPVLAAYAPALRRFICPGDTVRVAEVDRRPGIFTLCRVIDVVERLSVVEQHHTTPLNTHSHPGNEYHDGNSPKLLMQMILTKPESLQIHPTASWPIPGDAVRMATRGLIQVAHTNCMVVVHPELVTDLISVFHTSHCINHTFGAVAGRGNAFYTASNAVFDHITCDSLAHDLVTLPSDEYYIFGPSTKHPMPSIVTETEREVEVRYYFHRIFQKCLTKLGKIGGTSVYTGHLSRGNWSHFVSLLAKLDPSLDPSPVDIQMKDTTQAILHGDLSLETKYLPTTLTSITVKQPSHFAAMSSCLSQSTGIGIKKRPPNRTDLGLGRRVFDVQRADIIHLVNLILEGFDDHDVDDNWFPDDAVQREMYFDCGRNYCRFRYDERLREIRVTIKAMAITAGTCDAEPFMEFLRDRGVPWGSDEDNPNPEDYGLRLRRGVVIDDEMWLIGSVHREFDSVRLVRPDEELGETISVTISVARENLVPG